MNKANINKTYLKVQFCINKYSDKEPSFIISKISKIKIVGTNLPLGHETAVKCYNDSYTKITDDAPY